MKAVKTIAIVGMAAASLTLAPVRSVVAYDYMSAYGMYSVNGLWYSSNGYVEYIIQHESSGRTGVTNYLGCIGLMQSCPYNGHQAGLAVACPAWRTDVNCQLSFFSSYVYSRYGSWAAAYYHEYRLGWY